MGGKGSSGGPSQHQQRAQQPATGGDNRPRQQRRQSDGPTRQPQTQRMPDMPRGGIPNMRRQPSQQDMLRMSESLMQNLYTPGPKANPMAPGPAQNLHGGTNPDLAIPQADIDRLYGYGKTYAISDKDIDQLYSGGGGSLLDDDDGYGGYGHGL